MNLNSPMRILITGASGQLGQALLHLPIPNRWQWLPTDTDTLDITQPDQVNAYLERERPEICINAAAYTAVDLAEAEPEKARLINAEAVAHLARYCQQVGTHLIHVSTDFVFDGANNRPYQETDAPNPLSVYGQTKLAGEQNALQYCEKTTILRTSWLYGQHGNNFAKTMLRLASERNSLNVVADQVGTPTFTADLANLIVQLIALPQIPQGLFHFSNDGLASWYDFAHAIFSLTHSKIDLRPIRTEQFPTAAKRPAYSVLDKQKIKLQLPDFPFRHWRDALADCLEG